MLCPMCKQPLKSKYQQDQVFSAVSASGTKCKWVSTNRKTKTNGAISILQTQPLPCPEELDLLVGEVFDEFIVDSICEILLEPKLDNNPL